MSKKPRFKRSSVTGTLSPKIPDSVVDIITVVYGKPKFVKDLAETLFSFDAGVTFRWIIVDNDGPASDKAELEKIYASLKNNVYLVWSMKNLGFSGGNNLGFNRVKKAPYVLLLNSDIKVKKNGWLKAMVDEMEADKQVGVVGAKLLYFEDSVDPLRPAGKIQHAGVAFNMLGQPYHIFMGWSPDNPKVTVRREMNCVTGACLLTRTDLYKKIGGLAEEYTIGNFEDVEYCLRTRALGYKVVYTPNAELYHFAGGSNNTATAQYNEQLFRLRCGSITEYDEWRYY